MNSLTIVIPVYNEADNIKEVLLSIQKVVRAEYEVLVVYDFDEDNTLGAFRAIENQLFIKTRLVKNKYGRGGMNAIRTGFDEANSEYVVVTMADLSDPPSVINDMLECAKKNNATIVCGSRYMKGGEMHGGPFFKGILSRIAGLSLYYLARVKTHDATNAFKLYKKEFLDSIKIESNAGFELGLELVVKAHLANKLICEVPTSWTDRASGESHFRLFLWMPYYLKWYFKAYKKLLS